jgi:hypothetical protein
MEERLQGRDMRRSVEENMGEPGAEQREERGWREVHLHHHSTHSTIFGARDGGAASRQDISGGGRYRSRMMIVRLILNHYWKTLVL